MPRLYKEDSVVPRQAYIRQVQEDDTTISFDLVDEKGLRWAGSSLFQISDDGVFFYANVNKEAATAAGLKLAADGGLFTQRF